MINLIFSEQANALRSSTQIWVIDGMTKIRPNTIAPSSLPKEILLQAARNEYEPCQIVVAAGELPLKYVTIEVSPLVNKSGKTIPIKSSSIYREHFIDIKTPTNIEGAKGLWPDALIPAVDIYNNETRNAFPFALKAQAIQPIWIDLYVPADAAADLYTSKVKIFDSGKEIGNIILKLNVWNFQLPSTSSFPTSFGFSGHAAMIGHYGQYTNDDDILNLTNAYNKAALLHRLSLHGGSFIPPNCQVDANGKLIIDWQKYDKEVAPFLDGSALPNGAKFTTIDLRTPKAFNNDQKIAYWKQVAIHFKEKGWFDRLFDYSWDEPSENDFDKIGAHVNLLKKADNNLKSMVTKEWHKQLQSKINIWTVLINFIDDKPNNSNAPPRSIYDKEIASGNKLWFYQSCMSHGCNTLGGEYFTGWPAYIIDLPAIYSRMMPWIAWKYHIGGELYYNTIEAYTKEKQAGSSWQNLYYFGGNGDGTLFYPGLPSIIGGQSHIPIESIRLKMIREGLEDYEYLKLAQQANGQKVSDEVVNKIVQHTYYWEHDPAKLMAMRVQLAAIITGKASLTN